MRRSNRIRTIHGSLAIEQNTLSLEQVTAVLGGKQVLAPPKDIAEVKNAYEIYERLNELDRSKPIYVICQSGLRSYIASRILEGNGFATYNFSGGFRFYDTVINDRALVESSFACGMDK